METAEILPVIYGVKSSNSEILESVSVEQKDFLHW